MAIVNALPLANYPVGTYNFGPVAIADAVTSIDLRIARCTTANPTIWPSPGVTIDLRPEVLVGGQWVSYGACTSAGGISLAKNGGEALFTLCGGMLPEGVGRQLRGTLTIAGGALRTHVEIEVL